MQLQRTEIDPSSRLIIEEAERRGISYEILAPRAEYFRLRYGHRAVVCRESLSELTTAVALSRCDDKRATTRVLREAGLRTPRQVQAGSAAASGLHQGSRTCGFTTGHLHTRGALQAP